MSQIRYKLEISDSTYLTSQSPITDNLVHYRNIFAPPENLITRRVDYSKMKVHDEKYRKEEERLKSLDKLIITDKSLLSAMAKTGMYYKEKSANDQVSCIYCQGVFSNWKRNDVPVKRHKFSYPTCPYVINLNVGNEPSKYDVCKFSTEDKDVLKPRLVIHAVILKQKIEIDDEFLDQVNKFDIDFREKTFNDFKHLKDFAFQGFYVKYKKSTAFLKCCSCKKEMLILKGIENLGNDLMHKDHCKYKSFEKEIVEVSDISEDFCDVEYSLTTEEIDARMETRSISQLLENGINRDVLRSLIEYRLKSRGKDFDSQFELLQELKNDSRQWERKKKSNEYSFILTEYPCVVCLDKAVEVIFLPCGHLKTCNSCSDLVAVCPVCRVPIEKRVKHFRFQ